jgi:hypothetical protein
MNDTVLLVGVACLAAAIVGGGVKIANSEFPIVSSIPRQVLLGVLGIGVIVSAIGLFGGGSSSSVGSKPTSVQDLHIPNITLPTDSPFSVPDPAIKLSVSQGPPGTRLTVSGTGFQPRETIKIDFQTDQITEVHADAQGAFGDTPVQIPPDWQFKGQFPISATGDSSAASNEEPFQVT